MSFILFRLKKDLEIKVERLETSLDESKILLESQRQELKATKENMSQQQVSII